MTDFEMFSGQPAERKQWINQKFGPTAFRPGKSLAVQKASLINQLATHEVKWFDAEIMQAAVWAMPGLAKKDELSMAVDTETEMFSCRLGGEKEGTTKQFAKIIDARNWLLNMGKSSEAGF